MTGKNGDNKSNGNSAAGNQQPAESTGDNIPASDPGDVRRTDSGQGQQAEQQRMNAQAQQQAVQPATFAPAGLVPRTDSQGNEIPFFPAPRGHASDSITRLAQRAREQERTAAQVDLPASATQEALASARFVPMPAGGLHALSEQLYPDDRNNQEAMDNHILDLLILNRDTLNNDTSFMNGQLVRVPA